MQVGVLQQFGSTTFACTAGRNAQSCLRFLVEAPFFIVDIVFFGEGCLVVLEDVDKVCRSAQCVVHTILTKGPHLQGV